MTLIVVSARHPLRDKVEQFIGRVYTDHYKAVVPAFPPVLVAMLDHAGQIQCASGLRLAEHGFFSEAYLDAPIERVLARAAGESISREDILEVTTFASRAPLAATRFLRQIVAFGEAGGLEWAFFTATNRVRALLEKMALPLVVLGPADPCRLANCAAWGTYYASAPCVCAVPRHDAGARTSLESWSVQHA